MKVKVFDEVHEKDLEDKINNFLKEIEGDLVDIKYQVSVTMYGEDQIYCFSSMVIYHEK